MKREIELLAPGGDFDSIKAAILAGADAVYCGLDKFNARNRAKNITFEDLSGILRLAHQHDCELFITLNIIIVESEITALITLLNRLVNTSIDGIIVQDFGLLYILYKYFPTLKVHASTQLTTHNEGQIKFLRQLGVTRINLSRELNLNEISDLAKVADENEMLTEVFVHGSNCISFSGLCYISSVHGGNSGNRGRCSQPCRDQYLTTAEGKDFPLNIKDNSAFSDLGALADAGVDSIKIEGRIKKYHYVYTVVDSWRKQLQRFYDQERLNSDSNEFRKVFNRDFSNSFLQGEISREIFIDNPRDYSATHRAKRHGGATNENLTKAKRELYDLKTEIICSVKDGIEQLCAEKPPLKISISGAAGTPLRVSVRTPDDSFDLLSESELVKAGTGNDNPTSTSRSKRGAPQPLDRELLLSRFKALNDTEYFIDDLELDHLQEELFIPFRELTSIKKRILFILNGSKERVTPAVPPPLEKQSYEAISPSLSVLIASQKDLYLCKESSAEIYFQLPNSFSNGCSEFVELFRSSRGLIPWFPSVLIGEDYHTAVELLQQLQPERIVTNNTGIAYEAYRRGISWIAGPYLNLVNSFSLLSLQELFNCDGAFISNEINRAQIKRIRRPEGFELLYSIYHPIILMTSRVCLHHQVSGCKKNIVDDSCIQKCKKSSFITNMKNSTLFIDKERGGYHTVYNDSNYLNGVVVTEISNLFSRFLIDLRDIRTDTEVEVGKLTLVRLFESHLRGESGSIERLQQNIHPSTNTQYQKGI